MTGLPATEAMLVLSTGTLTCAICNVWLKQAGRAIFEKGDYGWFVYVTDGEDDDFPADLLTC